MRKPKNVIIHWGGKMINGSCGVDYEGGNTKLIRFRERVDHSQFIDKISSSMKIGLNQKVTKVVFRFPASTQAHANFSQLEIEDDDGVEFMFDSFERNPALVCMQLYVDVDSDPIHTEQHDNHSQVHVQEILQETPPAQEILPVAVGSEQHVNSSQQHDQESIQCTDPAKVIVPIAIATEQPAHHSAVCIQESMQHTAQAQERAPVTSQLHPKDYMHSGPQDASVLTLQRVHRSEAVWHDTLERQVIHCRRASSAAHSRNIDTRIVPYLQQAGFYGIACVGYNQLDWHLITALVERWRPETHTFHLPEGECTITLQDVGILTGLPVDGHAVTGTVTHDWKEVCLRLLGAAPPNAVINGSRLQISWLVENFDVLPVGANDFTIQCYARAFILRFIGGIIFPGKSSTRVHLMFLPLLEDFQKAGQYSWGAACLAWLYRELCRGTNPAAKEISGPLFLVQLWALVRLPHIASISKEDVPQEAHLPPGPLGCQWRNAKIVSEVSTQVLNQYRYALDRQGPDQMLWQPYTDDVIAGLPSYCTSGHAIWGSVVPLICFHIVEWHQADRVMRQFGLQQPIPVKAHQDDALHTIDLRGYQETNWVTQHASYISLWNDRHNRVIHGVLAQGRLHYHSEYMKWYRKVTRRWISHMGAAVGAVADGIEHIYLNSGANATLDHMMDIHETAARILGALDEERRTIRVNSTQRAPEPVQMPGLEQADTPASRRRRRQRTMADRRLPVEIDLSQPCTPVPQSLMFRVVASVASTPKAAGGRVTSVSSTGKAAGGQKRGRKPSTSAQMDYHKSQVVDTTDAPVLDDVQIVEVEGTS